MDMVYSCSFLGGAVGGAGYLAYRSYPIFTSRGMIMIVVSGGVAYVARKVADSWVATPIARDGMSCILMGAGIGALSIYLGQRFMF